MPTLPKPSGRVLRLKKEGFTINAQPVGVEVSPSLLENAAEPGTTQVGVVFQLRPAATDRPTPVPLQGWNLRRPARSADACRGLDRDGDVCVGFANDSSFTYSEQLVQSTGMAVLRSHGVGDLPTDGGLDQYGQMQPNTTYFVESYIDGISETAGVTDITMCVPPEIPGRPVGDCFTLAGLPRLPKR